MFLQSDSFLKKNNPQRMVSANREICDFGTKVQQLVLPFDALEKKGIFHNYKPDLISTTSSLLEKVTKQFFMPDFYIIRRSTRKVR